MKTRLKLLIAVFIGMGILSGCNTVQGVGKDVQSGGHAIQRAAS